jgi:hypothetical protein
MTLEEIYYVSQIVAVVAILASLIFVGIQVRQSVEQTKLANKLARADMSERAMRAFADVHSQPMSNRELADAFRKVMFEHSKLTPTETTQISFYFNVTIHAHRTAFIAVRDGLLDASVMKAYDIQTAWYLTAPMFAREWKRMQQDGLMSGDFAAHVNALPPSPNAAVRHRSPEQSSVPAETKP